MNDVELKRAISVAPELWGTSVLPEGILEQWIFRDGMPVEIGDPIAIVRIESALHEIMAPARGRLVIHSKANAVLEPGSVIGYIIRKFRAPEPRPPQMPRHAGPPAID